MFDTLHSHDDSIAVNGAAKVRSGNEDVAGVVKRPLGRDEAIAAGVRLQTADVQIHLLGQAEAMAADADEIAGRDERVDVPLERRPLLARHAEELENLSDAGGMMDPLTHQREHLIARVHSIFRLPERLGGRRRLCRSAPCG